MVAPTEVRSSFMKWFRKHLRIDYIGLNKPESIRDFEVPPSVGLDLASQFDISQAKRMGGTWESVTIEATIPYQFLYRFDSSYQYSQIPRAEAESILVWMMRSLYLDPECVHPDFLEIDPSGRIIVSEESTGDWLLLFDIEIILRFAIEPEDYNKKIKALLFQP